MRREHHNYTRDQVQEHISVAAQMVDDLGLPDELRQAAFLKAVDMLSAKSIEIERFNAPILGQKITGG